MFKIFKHCIGTFGLFKMKQLHLLSNIVLVVG